MEEWFWPFEPFSKLKAAFCEYWTSIKIKIRMTCVYREYEIKTKMVQEQWLHLWMKFLLVYNMKIVIKWGWPLVVVVGSLLGRFFQVGWNEQIFGWWGGGVSPHPPSRESPVLKSNFHVVKHANLQLCRVYPTGVIWKNWQWSIKQCVLRRKSISCLTARRFFKNLLVQIC